MGRGKKTGAALPDLRVSARRSTKGSRCCSRDEHEREISQQERFLAKGEEVDLAADRLLVLLANAGGSFAAMRSDTSAYIVRILMASGYSHYPLQEDGRVCLVEGDGNERTPP